MPDIELDSESGLVVPSPRNAALLFGRALLLRCPHCGGGPVLRRWFALRSKCGKCALRLERGEGDYFTGSMLFNLIIAELLFAAALTAVLLFRWPEIPWDTLEWAAPLAMLAAPFVIFPFSKLIWLAFDLILRPMTADELDWHRTHDTSTAR